MKTITFVRHGQSLANAGGITMDHDAIPLTELGLRQAYRVAEALERAPAQVLVSAYSRTHETAAPYCDKVGCSPRIHPSLHEFSTIDPALLIGMNGAQRRPIADAYWQAADPAARKGPHAETYEEFDRRVAAFLPELEELPDRTVVFGHGMWFGLVVWKLLGFTAADGLGMKAFRRFQLGLPLPNCAIYALIRSDDGQWRVRADEAAMRAVASVTSAAPIASITSATAA